MARKPQTSQLKRQLKNTPQKKLVLIYCNGETEKSYFQAIRDGERLTGVTVEVFCSTSNRRSLVDEVAAKLKSKTHANPEVWVVFDVDSKPDGKQINTSKINQEADKAVAECRRLKYKPVVSNDCFELWFCLHFEYCCSHLHRKQLLDKVKEKIPAYKKGESVYKHLKEHTDNAIKNAKKLCGDQPGYPDKYQVSQCQPFTNAHELVLRLRKLAEKE